MTDTLTPNFGPVRTAERDLIIQALLAGVVPRTGAHLLQVGRDREYEALLHDLDRIAEGGSMVRFLVAAFGAGKTLTLRQMCSLANGRKIVSAAVDLTAERRLAGGDGYARRFYQEVTAKLATRAQPDGGALGGIVERFVADSVDAAERDGTDPDAVIRGRLAALTEMPHGYDFAAVIRTFWRGHDSGDDQLRSDALRWLRGEFDTRTDARQALGVRSIIDDSTVFPALKLMAQLCRLAGYRGLLICIDELVAVYRLANTHARRANYETLLSIVNDALQGTAVGLGMAFAITPEMLFDPQRGLYSYPALHQRLAENRFATPEHPDFTGPVLRLTNLTQEELFVLLQKLRHIVAAGDPARYLVGDDALEAFMEHCRRQVGDRYVSTPRLAIKEFVGLLVALDQHPSLAWTDLLPHVVITDDHEPDDADPLRAGDATDAPLPAINVNALNPADGDLDTFRL